MASWLPVPLHRIKDMPEYYGVGSSRPRNMHPHNFETCDQYP